MAKSMTEGRPLKLIVQFALPLLLGNILQQTYNIIDAAIVGRILGTEALAGVEPPAVFSLWCWDSASVSMQALVFRCQKALEQDDWKK